ncbi:hypothetical protein ACFE04_018706 [Oxalis oulophora]
MDNYQKQETTTRVTHDDDNVRSSSVLKQPFINWPEGTPLYRNIDDEEYFSSYFVRRQRYIRSYTFTTEKQTTAVTVAHKAKKCLCLDRILRKITQKTRRCQKNLRSFSISFQFPSSSIFCN